MTDESEEMNACTAHEIRDRLREAWRRDARGVKMRYASYGTTGEYGWEIDHIIPRSKGGTGSLSSLQPLHWKGRKKEA